MRYGGFHFLGALLFLCCIGVLVALAFGAGVAADGGSYAVHSGGWHFLGFLFGLFIVLMIFGMICRAGRYHMHGAWDRPGPGGPGGPGSFGGPAGWHGHGYGRRHGGWHGEWRHDEECRDSAKSALDDWHRQAHGEAPNSDAPSGQADGGTKS